MSLGWGGWKSAVQSAAQTIANLVGQDIVARSISLTQAASSVAVQLVNGARLKLGTGTTDYLTSDGATRITAAGEFTVTGQSTFSGTMTTAGVSVGAGSNVVLGAGSGLYSTGVIGQRTAPTISAGFGAGASVVANNGTFAFTINTGAASASGTIGLPAATTGWVVLCQNITTNDANHAQTKMTSSTSTTAVIGNFTSGGVSGNWAANDVIACIAIAF